MSETNIQDQQTDVQNKETETQKPASIGKLERLNIKIPQDNSEDQNNQNTNALNTGGENQNNGANATNANNGGADKKDAPPAPTLTDEQLKEYFKAQGIEYEGVEKLKEKLNYKPTDQETPEQKTQAALAKEKRVLDLFIANGGTAEQYVGIKAVAEGDVKELSMTALKKELKDAKFSEEEIATIIKERYYQMDDEEIEAEEDETKDFKKRLKEYGANKLANRSLHTQKQAQGILAELNKTLESENLQQAEEVTISSNIDEHFKKLPRKYALEIGELNGKPIPPIDYEVSDSDEKELKEIQSMLKNPDKRNNLLFNKDGNLNITKLSELLVENKLLKSQLKTVYHEGGSRQVAEFEKVFPARTAHELGVGGSPNKQTGEKGKPASFGATQRVRPQQHN